MNELRNTRTDSPRIRRSLLVIFSGMGIEFRNGMHALRTTFACLIAICITRLFDIPHSSWTIVTIVVVMGPASYFRTTLSKASQRLIGTLVGAFAGVFLHLIPVEKTITHGILLLLLLGIASYFFWSRYSYAAILAAVTLAIVSDVQLGDLSVTEWRVFNVILGTSIIWFCSRFVFPERALSHFQLMISEFLQLVADYYLLHLFDSQDKHEKVDLNIDLLSQNLAQQHAILAHVKSESRQQTDTVSEILTLEHRLLGLVESLLTDKWSHSIPNMLELGRQLFDAMNILSLEIAEGDVSQYTSFDFLDYYEDFDLSHLNQCSYVWLNHQLSQQISQLSNLLQKICYHSNY
ncbi:hypothetical protein GCM10007938_35380 [Vibrio zhanjiangensis]|uniref:FUSC family protein n=1 Tax=Vibrio zhanjiangensis TaxID=1046128 RepID=A0ABQ6F4H7_9VIBR|nr:FUSC family protein [Vibrio zhanjiangensis]GLT19755.1 hypothetical protein GCM10007938_35380 [Vibrio zhanjiangensis]